MLPLCQVLKVENVQSEKGLVVWFSFVATEWLQLGAVKIMGIDATAYLKLVGFKLVRVSANFRAYASSHTHSFTYWVVAVEI